uniref:Laccase n=1 Tax=Salix viminalis TaxID=40686 RepID=A0A6N2KYY5_SALVM
MANSPRPIILPSMAALQLFSFFICSSVLPDFAAALTRQYTFNIKYQNFTRLCHTRSLVTVNGQFPGPRLVAREGDRVLVTVVNHVAENITIHWHGVRQLTSGWADGPAYVTQCPIQTGQAYTYNFTITGQRGTLLWHAHLSWLRSSLYGPIIILPKLNESYPFKKPYKEIPILFGEWFNVDPEAVIAQALQTGAGPNVSDAYTINGLPGPLYNCSAKVIIDVACRYIQTEGKARKNLPSPTNQRCHSTTSSFSALPTTLSPSLKLTPFMSNLLTSTHSSSVQDKLQMFYSKPSLISLMQPFSCSLDLISQARGPLTTLPLLVSWFINIHLVIITFLHSNQLCLQFNATAFVANFTKKFRSLASAKFPANVPQTVDRRFFFTVGLGTSPCPKNTTCQGPNNKTKFSASINNVSFVLPSLALLQSYFFGQSNGVFTSDFPQNPATPFNYTGAPPNNTMVSNGTKTVVLTFNTSVELVLQGTSILGAESHPLHLHGFNFFVVGQGFGNYDPNKDPSTFNLADPVERNTAGVPAGGWIAIRFLADNPGVWFMHCHLDIHTSWGLRMAWIVLDGAQPNQKLPPPPSDLPKC